MGASHKLAGSYLSIQTAMPSSELLNLADLVAAEVHKRQAGKPGPVVKIGRTQSSVDFAVLNIWKKQIMRFRVRAVGTADGRTELKSQITYFRTLQQKMFLFIPAGPKRLVGWNVYSTFMDSLRAAASDVDNASRAMIVNAAG
jgi:hypothetical protein